MSTVVSRRRGTAAQVAAVAGAVGEILPDMTNMRLTLHNGTTLGGFPQAAVSDIVGRNRIINGNFAINQRGYASGGTLGAVAYAHDRWKDTGGGTWKYTFSQGVPDTLITITAGAGGQVIEAANIEGGNYMLSWLGTAPMAVFFTNTAGTVTSVSGATSPLAVTGVAPGTQLVVASNGNGTLGLVQFEAGTVATKFERRHIGQELALCQRYYEVGNYSILGNAYAASAYLGIDVPFKVTKRASPSVAIVNTFYVNAQSNTVDTFNMDMMRIYIVSTGAATNVQGVGTWAASAEL